MTLFDSFRKVIFRAHRVRMKGFIINLLGILLSSWCVVTFSFAGFSASSDSRQIPQKTILTEQTSFGMEGAFEHPVALNEAAIGTLAADRAIADVLKDDQITDLSIFQKWFTASEIHLGGPNERDLVVMSIGIELGANTTIFRILRLTSSGYRIVLHTQALDLEVLDTRTNGLRDIRVEAAVGGYAVFVDYKFDGQAYQLVRRSSSPIGFELPHDLTGYETRKPFTQIKGHDEEPILAEARAWIWQRWQAHKRSYVKVYTEDADGEKRRCAFFVDDASETHKWQVALEIHQTVWDQDSPSGPRYLVVEDKLEIASGVERIEPTEDDSHPHILADKDEIPPSEYRLSFLDGNYSVFLL